MIHVLIDRGEPGWYSRAVGSVLRPGSGERTEWNTENVIFAPHGIANSAITRSDMHTSGNVRYRGEDYWAQLRSRGVQL